MLRILNNIEGGKEERTLKKINKETENNTEWYQTNIYIKTNLPKKTREENVEKTQQLYNERFRAEVLMYVELLLQMV